MGALKIETPAKEVKKISILKYSLAGVGIFVVLFVGSAVLAGVVSALMEYPQAMGF